MTWEKKAQGSGSKNPMFKGFAGIDLRSIGYPEKTGPKSTCFFADFGSVYTLKSSMEMMIFSRSASQSLKCRLSIMDIRARPVLHSSVVQ